MPAANPLLTAIEKLETGQQAMVSAITALSKPVNKGVTPATLFATAKNHEEDRKFGFKSFSDYIKAVRSSSNPGEAPDPRFRSDLYTKAVSGMSEGSGPDGGFLIPPEFSNTILQRVYENDLLSRCQSYNVAGNVMVFPAIDETSRVDGSRFGGVQAYWMDEAGQVTSSKPKFNRIQLVLKKLAALAYVTDELMTDSGTPLEQYLTKLFAQEIEFKVGDAIINGTGVGTPLGILTAGCLVSVSKETGQAAATITTENIVKMWQRMYGPSRANAVWLINQDIENQLHTLSLGIGTAGVATYLPPGGLSDKPYATLMGRPVVTIEAAATLGTVGDIILADLSQYLVIRKGELATDSSMHLRFDFLEQAFRVVFRMDGQPWWKSSLTPFKGTATLSPFVALSTRA